MIDFSKVPLPDAPVGATFGSEWAEAPRYDTEASDVGAVVDLNLDGAKRALKIFDEQIAHWEAEAKALVVNSAEAAANATEMTGQVKRLVKQIDDRRKEIISEPDSYVRKVNGFCKPFADRLKALEGYIKRKFSDYALQVELQRREMERRQQEAAKRLQAELDAEAKAKGVEPVQVAPVAVPTRKEPTRSDSAVASTIMVTDFEITDAAALPRQYLMPDERAIREAIRSGGITDIPGVRIFERAEVRVRRVG